MPNVGDITESPVDRYLKELTFLEEKRRPWEPQWRDINDMVLPRKSFWDETDKDGGKRAAVKNYDSTPRQALQTMTDGMQGYSVSSAFRWFKLKMQSLAANNLPFVRDWLEDAEEAIYSELNLSNFYEGIGESFMDAGGIGTAIMFVEDRVHTGRTVFSARHIRECYIDEDRRGRVDTVWRKFNVRLEDIVEDFGEDALPKDLKDRYKVQPLEMVEVIHGVFPRKRRETSRRDGKNKKWASVYIHKASKTILKEDGYDDFPYVVWRFRKNSFEVYGRSPAFDAIPDILRLNQMARTMTLASQKAVEPPLNVPTAMKNKTRLLPNGENIMDATGQKLEPIQFGAYPFGIDALNDLRGQIRELFNVSFFLMLNNLLAQGAKTATEVMEMQGEKAAVLGVVIGRLNAEFLAPLIDKVFFMLLRDGVIPPPPEELIREGGKISIEFMGPLAQAQRRYHKTQGVQATLQLLGSMVQIEGTAKQVGSTVIDNADLDALYREGADSAGTPQRGLREEPERDQMRAARAQQMAEQQQQAIALEQQKMLSQNAEKLNQPLQKGSMLDQVVGGR